MTPALLITTNMPGIIGGFVKHEKKQIFSVPLPNKEVMTKNILHSDREEKICKRNTIVSERILAIWTSKENPEWENQRDWKRFSQKQKINSYVKNNFDEGFGVSWELLN